MRLTHRALLSAPPDSVRAILQDPTAWGALGFHPRPTGRGHWAGEWRLQWPRVLTLEVDAEPTAHGLRFTFAGEGVRGSGEISAVALPSGDGPDDAGASVVLDVDVVVSWSLPGAWWAELEAEVMPRWVRAIAARSG